VLFFIHLLNKNHFDSRFLTWGNSNSLSSLSVPLFIMFPRNKWVPFWHIAQSGTQSYKLDMAAGLSEALTRPLLHLQVDLFGLLSIVYLTKGPAVSIFHIPHRIGSDRIDWCNVLYLCAPLRLPKKLLKRLEAHLKQQQIVTFQWLFNVLHFYVSINTFCLASLCPI